MFATIGAIDNINGRLQPRKTVSFSDVYLHLRASHAIFFQNDKKFKRQIQKTCLTKNARLLRDVCGAIGEHPSWAYAGETRDKKIGI